MSTRLKLIIGGLLALYTVPLLMLLLNGKTIAILDPKGPVASQQYNLIVFATLLSLLVIVPVYILTIYIAVKYRAGNKKAKYTPDWEHNKHLETLWWGLPIVIIGILSVITWQTSHSLDPHRQIVSSKKPLTIQVVSLQWKWLFIYPEQKIATVNYVQIPEDTPVKFEVTADSPMNSFWIPQLGSQIYAMNGMLTQVNLEASEIGEYQGVSANISGEGFAGMKFIAHATSEADFAAWVTTAQGSDSKLDFTSYNQLALPTKDNALATYALTDEQLLDQIIMKFTEPAGTKHVEGMHHN